MYGVSYDLQLAANNGGNKSIYWQGSRKLSPTDSIARDRQL